MPDHNPYFCLLVELGLHFLFKWRARLKQDSHLTVARQMRKQGIPLGTTLQLLFGREERFTQPIQQESAQ